MSTKREDKEETFQAGLLSQELWGTVQVREERGGQKGFDQRPKSEKEGETKGKGSSERDPHLAVKRLSYEKERTIVFLVSEDSHERGLSSCKPLRVDLGTGATLNCLNF